MSGINIQKIKNTQFIHDQMKRYTLIEQKLNTDSPQKQDHQQQLQLSPSSKQKKKKHGQKIQPNVFKKMTIIIQQSKSIYNNVNNQENQSKNGGRMLEYNTQNTFLKSLVKGIDRIGHQMNIETLNFVTIGRMVLHLTFILVNIYLFFDYNMSSKNEQQQYNISQNNLMIYDRIHDIVLILLQTVIQFITFFSDRMIRKYMKVKLLKVSLIMLFFQILFNFTMIATKILQSKVIWGFIFFQIADLLFAIFQVIKLVHYTNWIYQIVSEIKPIKIANMNPDISRKPQINLNVIEEECEDQK